MVANWKQACERIVIDRKMRGKPVKHKFETGEELYQWWVSGRRNGN